MIAPNQQTNKPSWPMAKKAHSTTLRTPLLPLAACWELARGSLETPWSTSRDGFRSFFSIFLKKKSKKRIIKNRRKKSGFAGDKLLFPSDHIPPVF